MTADAALLAQLAAALEEAERGISPIPPIAARHPALTVEDAYEIQEIVARHRVEAGDPVVGYKVGLTSRVMQDMMGVNEPDSGYLFGSQVVGDNALVSCTGLCQPRVEFEIGFVLERDVAGPACTALEVLRATAFVVPAIEIIDSRIANWEVALVDTVADNGSAARAVFGGIKQPVDSLDLRLMGVVVRHNGAVVTTGAGGAVLGNPVTAVAWLANRLGALGRKLPAGSLVLPGSCTRALPVGVGDVVRADYDGMGSVTVAFVE